MEKIDLLSTLPNEILVYVLSFLNKHDIYNVSVLNKHYYNFYIHNICKNKIITYPINISIVYPPVVREIIYHHNDEHFTKESFGENGYFSQMKNLTYLRKIILRNNNNLTDEFLKEFNSLEVLILPRNTKITGKGLWYLRKSLKKAVLGNCNIYQSDIEQLETHQSVIVDKNGIKFSMEEIIINGKVLFEKI